MLDVPRPMFLKRYDFKSVRGWGSANDMTGKGLEESRENNLTPREARGRRRRPDKAGVNAANGGFAEKNGRGSDSIYTAEYSTPVSKG